MKMKRTGCRHRKGSFNPPPPPTPQFRRDSDVSFASSRPSSIGMARPAAASSSINMYKERAVQISAVNSINSSLKELFSHSFNVTFKPFSPPSLKDLTDTIHLLLQCLDYHSTKLEDDLPIILKSLGYPFKINKSILKNPPAPHQWYQILALLHWLVQVSVYNYNLANDSNSFITGNDVNIYALNNYVQYIRGDDDLVEALDQEFMERLKKERDDVVVSLKELEEEVKELEAKAEALWSNPSQREILEKQQSLLEEDVKKFHTMIAGYSEKMQEIKKNLEEKEKELEVKVQENKKICEEHGELRKRVDSQMFNNRDVVRMRRELQAVERDISDAEVSRNVWEEKTWDLHAAMGNKFKELEVMAIECNQAMRRLKLDNCHQYFLNAKGSTPTDVMGIDYKTTVKPALDSFVEDIKKSSMVKLDDLISLRKQSSENTAKIESRHNEIASLQSHIHEVETQLNSLKDEIRDHALRCSTESKKMVEDVQQKAHNLDLVEREALETLKNAKLKHEEAIKQGEEEIQICARELVSCVDSVSEYKEFVSFKISDMKSYLSNIAVGISEAYKNSLPALQNSAFEFPTSLLELLSATRL
ncbi:kinetochore protein NDC80 homolog [Benincasa hispida]|uniref:kinetochore protein NDC80 homolog n=1 Tax=Benincasa hispida TaxID=102211 RepID=UPI0018FF9943|nr:kinetochore protein NDC80 homolog [Benincasa hispida]